MKAFNVFYAVVALLGISLYFILKPEQNTSISFFGFAESNQTEINYNYPVVVDKISVKPGESVEEGDTLMKLSRRKSKETLNDQDFKIQEILAEISETEQIVDGKIKNLKSNVGSRIEKLERDIEALQKEKEFNEDLAQGLQSIKRAQSSYSPIQDEIETLRKEQESLIEGQDVEVSSLKNERDAKIAVFRRQIERLQAEQEFESETEIIEIVVTSPGRGLIGSISCKEEEHIPSYKTLLTFYESTTTLIKGFVHEDLTLHVQTGSQCTVSSLKDENLLYQGRVMGLGSRIVEIPSRLRKNEAIKTYGREVLVEITPENAFLQKEKVAIYLDYE